VAPGLRVGWFVLPDELVAPFDDRAVSTMISPPLLPQAAVHELFERNAFEPNLHRICGLLRSRRDAMLASLERELDGRVSWSRPEGGYFCWLEIDGGDAGALLTKSTEAGVTFVKGADFFPSAGNGADAARLAFSYESPERIAEGVSTIAALLSA
jgi:2-aminoadipate transaminase